MAFHLLFSYNILSSPQSGIWNHQGVLFYHSQTPAWLVGMTQTSSRGRFGCVPGPHCQWMGSNTPKLHRKLWWSCFRTSLGRQVSAHTVPLLLLFEIEKVKKLLRAWKLHLGMTACSFISFNVRPRDYLISPHNNQTSFGHFAFLVFTVYDWHRLRVYKVIC